MLILTTLPDVGRIGTHTHSIQMSSGGHAFTHIPVPCTSVEWVHVCLDGVGACVPRWSGCMCASVEWVHVYLGGVGACVPVMCACMC